jgi:hypothetical protein
MRTKLFGVLLRYKEGREMENKEMARRHCTVEMVREAEMVWETDMVREMYKY